MHLCHLQPLLKPARRIMHHSSLRAASCTTTWLALVRCAPVPRIMKGAGRGAMQAAVVHGSRVQVSLW
jgi:hypothetical protein